MFVTIYEGTRLFLASPLAFCRLRHNGLRLLTYAYRLNATNSFRYHTH